MNTDDLAPIKTETPKMKQVCLLYLDILGYKKFIERNGYNKAFELIDLAFKTSGKYMAALNDYFETNEIEYKGYSDNLLFYFELKNDRNDYQRFYALADLASVLQESFVVMAQTQLRGAITIGHCYIGDYIFGEAFMEAYEMESNMADWGRVVVSEKAVHSFHSPNGKIVVPFLTDGGLFYLDFLAMSLDLVANEDYKQHMKNFYESFRHMYVEIIDEMKVAKTLGEMIEISKIVDKNNQMLDYISSYCVSSGLEIKDIHVFKEDRLLAKWKEFKSQLNSMDDDTISAVKGSLDDLIRVFDVYWKSLNEHREMLMKL